MAAECNISIIAELLGLGKDDSFPEKFSTITPTRFLHHYMIQASADADEALPIGDVGTVECIIMKCIANDVDVDTSYVSSFVAEIEIQEGQVAVFKPTGTVRIKNNDSSEQSTIEYWVIGTA